MSDLVYVLHMGNTPDIRVFDDPEVGLLAYIDHARDRLPDGFEDPLVEMNSDGGSYSMYYDGSFVASLTTVRVEHG